MTRSRSRRGCQLVVVGPLYREWLCSVSTGELRAGAEYLVSESRPSWKVGGSAVNVASEVSRLGEHCRVIGAWSRGWAKAIRHAPRNDGVEWNVVELEGEAGWSLGIGLKDGDATFVTDVGVNRYIRAEHVLPVLEELEEVPLVLVTGYVKLVGLHGGGLGSIAAAVRRQGGMVAMDTGRLQYPLEEAVVEMICDAIESVGVFLLNAEEAQVLAGQEFKSGIEAAKALASRYREVTVALKMGPHGAALLKGGNVNSRFGSRTVQSSAGYETRRLVGAGDVFNAAFLVERWLRGKSDADALEFAVAVASASTHVGTVSEGG